MWCVVCVLSVVAVCLLREIVAAAAGGTVLYVPPFILPSCIYRISHIPVYQVYCGDSGGCSLQLLSLSSNDSSLKSSFD